MRRFISFNIGDEPIEDGRIEDGHLVIRLPADFPPDFKGQINVQLESTKACGCLSDEACSHDHSGCGTPCGAPDCDANVESRFEPHPDCDGDGFGIGGLVDNCVAVTPDQRDIGEWGQGVYECAGDRAISCSTVARRLPVQEWADGLDDDCDGTIDELPPA